MTATLSRIHVISEGVLASYIHDLASPRPPVQPAQPAPQTVAEEDSGGNPG
jgi:hypothetical protein